MIDSERWRLIDRVLDAALEHDRAEWPALLAAECGEDHELRREVEDLLRGVGSVGGFLETPPAASAGALIASFGADARGFVGRRIGAYRVLREIGTGGMSRVFLAERADGQFEQRVALKLLRPGFDTEVDRDRFRAERQILAGLSHPNVARLYDGGMLEDGSPYLVLELVEGQPIDRFCDERRLAVRERLELFLSVIEATQYAHRNLVVHRDLKPSNILVSEDGTVKLLDFGLAKLLEPLPAGDQAPTTITARRWMTPEYAAPEQVRGGAVTTLTDVYQLGAVLFELLTGQPPFGGRGAAVHVLEEAVLRTDPPLPSSLFRSHPPGSADADGTGGIFARRRGVRRALCAPLRGDLDAIVLQAMRKEPEQRYSSAQALADDIRRHLTGVPVLARKHAAAYRAGRFARRHRWPIAAAATIVLLLAGYAITVTAQRAQVQRALDQATLGAAKAEQVTDLMLGLFQASEGGRAFSDSVTARDLLDRGATRARELVGQPEVRAQMLDVLGSIHAQLGNYADAHSMYEEALTARREILPEDHADVATSYANLADVLSRSSAYERAIPLQREALKIRRRVLGVEHPTTLQTLYWLGNILHESGDAASAAPLFDEWIVAASRQPRQVTPERALQLRHLGQMLSVRGEHARAGSLLREAVATRRALYGDRHPLVANVLRSLGAALRDAGLVEESEDTLREAVAILRAAYPNGHADLAIALRLHALALQRLGRWDEAETLFRETEALRRKLHGPDHVFVGNSMEDQGVLLLRRGDPARAEPFLREALRIYAFHFGDSSLLTIRAGIGLGDALLGQGAFEEAEPLLLRGYAAYADPRAAVLGSGLRQFAVESLTRLYEAQGRTDQAATFRALLDR